VDICRATISVKHAHYWKVLKEAWPLLELFVISSFSVPYMLITRGQTDRGQKKLEAQGPTPTDIRTIPFFDHTLASKVTPVTIET
jgi:hypothetical protein